MVTADGDALAAFMSIFILTQWIIENGKAAKVSPGGGILEILRQTAIVNRILPQHYCIRPEAQTTPDVKGNKRTAVVNYTQRPIQLQDSLLARTHYPACPWERRLPASFRFCSTVWPLTFFLLFVVLLFISLWMKLLTRPVCHNSMLNTKS